MLFSLELPHRLELVERQELRIQLLLDRRAVDLLRVHSPRQSVSPRTQSETVHS